MIIINSVSNTLFSFNGIEYFRNYISVIRGERIEIFNCYERDDVMLPLTHYSEVSLNGITYSNATDLQSVLQTVIYSRATLGSDEVEVVEQNNVGKVIYLDYVSGSDLLTQVLGDINSQTTLISATDNPVFFTAYKSASTASVAQKLRFQFMGGKGTWGAGGSAVLPSHLYQLPPESLLPEDITANSKSNVISLGQVTNEPEFLTKANSAVRDLTDTSKLHYFSYSLDSVLYLKRFTGQPGEYDGTQTVLTETDFNDATNSNVQPGLYLPTLKDITAVDSFTDSPITITDNNTGDNITFSGSSIKHTSVNGDTTILDYQPNTEDVTYSIPAKSTDDVFAMQSDVNGITIVANQSASELYLKNVDGTTLATINLGFLNNEGTTFFYNETSEKLELKNDDGEVLSEVPVSAFVANLMQSVNFNGSTPQTLEFKDAEGNVVDSVTFTVSNIQGLQNALDGKISTYHPSNNITSGNLADWQKAFTDYVSRRESSPVVSETFNGDMNTMNKGTYMTYMSTTATNKPFTQVGGLISIGSANVGFQILGSRDGNELWFRSYSGTYGSWYRLWNSEDFTLTGELGASEDLNTYTETGIYTQDSNVDASGGTNYPTPYAGILKVFRKGDFIWQTYHSYSLQNEIFHRGRNSSGNWVSWVRSWDNSDFSQSNINNWNSVYADKSNYLRNQADGTVGNYLGGTSITNINNLITGMVWTSGSVLNLPSAVSYLVFSLSGSNGYSAQLAMRNTNFFFRANENGTWGSWKRIWHADDFSQTNIENWDASWSNKKIDSIYVNGGDGTDANIEFSGAGGHKFSYGSGTWLANRAWSAYGGLITFKRNDINAHGLQFQYDVGHLNPTGGRLAFRTSGDTIKPWKTIWNDGDFTQSNIDNWNTAYNRGDFKDYGLGESILPVTDLTSPNANVNRFFRFLSSANGSGGFAGGAVSIRYDNTPSTSFIGANGSYAFVGYKNGENATPQFYKLWDARNFTQSNIDNWTTAYNRGDYKDYGLGTNALSLNNFDIITQTGFYYSQGNTVGAPTTNSSISLMHIDQGTNATQFAMRSGTDEYWLRRRVGSTWSSWVNIWTSQNFTTTDISNWNAAYNRGDYKDYGLGINTSLIYPETDLNSTTVPNGFYTVPNTILNIPTNAGGALTVERYSTYITQKYQAVNAGDVVRMFIRHYKTGAASWTPWREVWTDENFSPNDKAEVNDTLSFKGIIPSNDDINSYTVNGFYSTESSTTANLPVEDKGILTVASNGNDHSQTYTNYNSNEFYFRTSNPSGGGWNSWEKVAKSSERVINDTLTTPPSAASLTALYPSVKPTFTVIAPNVEKGNMYVKTNDGWLVFTGNTVF